MVLKMSRDYSKGKIYLIRNSVNDLVYVGSTTQSLGKRFKLHKEDSTKPNKQHWKLYDAFSNLGTAQFRIELIEKFPCSEYSELLRREGFFIRHFNSIENGYNTILSGRTAAEYKQDNRERILERDRQHSLEYRHKNLDMVSQKAKLYYARPEVKERKQAYAKQYNKEHTEDKHEYNKAYMAAKGDVVRARASESVTCEHCGKEIRRDYKKKHIARCTKPTISTKSANSEILA